MTRPRFLIKTRVLTIIYGADVLASWNTRLLIVCFCYREDLSWLGDRPPSALRIELRFGGKFKCAVYSEAKTILDRNLAVAEGRTIRKVA